MHSYEIEIKSLLGSKEKADDLLKKMRQEDPNLQSLGSHKQLNHYFTPVPFGTGQAGGSLKSLLDNVQHLLDDSARDKLKDLAEKVLPRTLDRSVQDAAGAQAIGAGAKNFSVRTREADSKVILVVKAAVDGTTSENGTARLEWEAVLFPPLRNGEGLREGLIKSIDELDNLVLSAGFSYQAKWSRERSNFIFHPSPASSNSLPPVGRDREGVSVSIDKNAGYGYLAEFEMVVDDESKANDAKNLIRTVMGGLKIDELPQDRLAKMFDFYNKNWQKYYGTEEIFVIE